MDESESTEGASVSRGPASRWILRRADLDRLLGELRSDGHRLIGPVHRDGAIVYDEIACTADLPEGWTDVQAAGRYRTERRDDLALFGFAVGPHSWKKFLHVARLTLFRTEHHEGRLRIIDGTPDTAPGKLALLGVRACELAAIAVQDRVLLEGAGVDPHYARRRAAVFIIAVECGTPGGTCFCTSMGTGPRVERGYDLALTELIDETGSRFVARPGSEQGQALLERLGVDAASAGDTTAADAVPARTAARIGRTLEVKGLRDILVSNPEHPRWEEVAARCLACGNCTMVCPTCFCTTIEDTSSLDGARAERTRAWDSCFTLDYSYLHGGSVRTSVRGRYRQWMTHKLATWIDQFGTSGCVGCGRCITWCPTGIDITEEAAAIRASGGGSPAEAEAQD